MNSFFSNAFLQKKRIFVARCSEKYCPTHNIAFIAFFVGRSANLKRCARYGLSAVIKHFTVEPYKKGNASKLFLVIGY